MGAVLWSSWQPPAVAPRITDPAMLCLAAEVGARLRRAGQTLATAESCTGGGLAWLITTVPGSSDWFDRGFVVYHNQAKQDMLGVPAATLSEHGAVSAPTVRAMAEGACRHSTAQISVAITGIAGPDGGSDTRPVGTVWLAWHRPGQPTHARRFLYTGDRDAVRSLSCHTALIGLSHIPDLLPP